MEKRTPLEITAAKERMFAFKHTPGFKDFLVEMERVKQSAITYANMKNDANIDTKTIGILKGIDYALNPDKYVV